MSTVDLFAACCSDAPVKLPDAILMDMVS